MGVWSFTLFVVTLFKINRSRNSNHIRSQWFHDFTIINRALRDGIHMHARTHPYCVQYNLNNNAAEEIVTFAVRFYPFRTGTLTLNGYNWTTFCFRQLVQYLRRTSDGRAEVAEYGHREATHTPGDVDRVHFCRFSVLGRVQ